MPAWNTKSPTVRHEYTFRGSGRANDTGITHGRQDLHKWRKMITLASNET